MIFQKLMYEGFHLEYSGWVLLQENHIYYFGLNHMSQKSLTRKKFPRSKIQNFPDLIDNLKLSTEKNCPLGKIINERPCFWQSYIKKICRSLSKSKFQEISRRFLNLKNSRSMTKIPGDFQEISRMQTPCVPSSATVPLLQLLEVIK